MVRLKIGILKDIVVLEFLLTLMFRRGKFYAILEIVWCIYVISSAGLYVAYLVFSFICTQYI